MIEINETEVGTTSPNGQENEWDISSIKILQAGTAKLQMRGSATNELNAEFAGHVQARLFRHHKGARLCDFA